MADPRIGPTETVGDIVLACNWWDCECNKRYIHPKTVTTCFYCGADEDEQPNSRLEEVVAMLRGELE